jgi:acyl-CoA synthetase (AMP-forming)/AMP-acid ligase II
MDYFKSFRNYVQEENIDKKQAVFFGEKATTYGELIAEAEQISTALGYYGVKRGDVVSLYLGNCKEFLSLFLGVARAGAIAQPLNILLTEYEVQPQLEKTQSRLIFVSPAHLAVVDSVRPRLPQLKNVVLMAGRAQAPALPYSDFLKKGRESGPPPDLEEDDVVLILFTGGTTGTPKAVMLTHKNLLSVVQGLKNRLGQLGEMVVLCASPLSHIFGLNTISFASLFRKSLVVLEEWFQLEEAVGLIERFRISALFGVPTVVRSIVDVADKCDLRSLRLILTGAAPVPEDLYHRVEEAFHCYLVEGWGLTEGTGCTTVTPPGVRKVGSCGIPYEGIGLECAIFDKDDNPLPPGEIGELVQRGPLNMKGYLGNPEATAEVLRNGWLHTGDLARMDADGYIYIVDRKKDVIIRGGFNVYPAEVEAVLYDFPGVAEAAVFGVADSRKGETVAAALLPRAGVQIKEEEVLAHCRKRLARYKVPKYLRISADPLPKTPAGKIMRRIMKEDLEEEIKRREK